MSCLSDGDGRTAWAPSSPHVKRTQTLAQYWRMHAAYRVDVQDGSLEKGRVVLLPWRVATKLQMSSERFEGLLAVAETKTPGLKSVRMDGLWPKLASSS